MTELAFGGTPSSLSSVPAVRQESLCDVCRRCPFAETGFHPEVLRHLSKMSITGSRASYKFNDALSKAKSCYLCARMVDVYHSFCKENYNDNVDLSADHVWIHSGLCHIESTAIVEKGGLVRLRMHLSFRTKNRSPGLAPTPSIKFQRCDPDPPTVDAFCSADTQTDWTLPQSQPYGGRIRSLVANRKLFLRWKETCRIRHGTSCMNPDKGTRICGLRFIDVQRRCLIDGEETSRYVALSYLWGKAPSPEDKLCAENAQRLYQPFSLTIGLLPATVEDAITVTAELGESFLWVDRLCIEQDNDIDKAKFMPEMNLIYGNAEVTIVAAAGSDCDAGLPGIHPKSRVKLQQVVSLNDITVMESLDPPCDAIGWTGLLSGTTYSERGWCYQERLLTFRALIFTAEQVYWECQQATWCEESFWESPDEPPLYRHSFLNNSSVNLLRQPRAQASHEVDVSVATAFKEVYPLLAETYSDRRLSYVSDSLNAFQGILQQLQKGFNQQFYWALPVSYIEDALVWEAQQDIVTRNNAHHFQLKPNGNAESVPFPSWSWVGWVGRASMGSDSAPFRELPPIIIFYRVSHGLEMETVYPKAVEQHSKRIQLDGIPPPWLHPHKTSITYEMVPRHILEGTLATTILCFWTSVARMRVFYRPGTPTTNEEKAFNYTLALEQGDYELNARNMQTSFVEPGLYDFAVIRREVFRHEVHSDQLELNALILVWEEGVAYRIGLVEIKEEHWMKLQNEWRLIVLG